ncbi:MAG TPA: hypothetical protein VMB03_23195 [Bryobacteraceae bacterium]|nr:hypothetical protein [Bryobacteraceae bacterium]
MTSKVALFLALPALTWSQSVLASWTRNSDPGSGMSAREIAFSGSDMRDAVAAVHAIVKTQKISPDQANQSITVEGNAREVALAEWLLGELGAPQANPNGRGFIMPQDSDDVTLAIGSIQVGMPISAGPPHVATLQDLKDLANAIHVVADIPRTTVYAPTGVLVWRGKVWQNDFVLWLLRQLATPPSVNWTAPISHQLEQASRSVRVFYFAAETSVQDLGEIVSTVRQKARLQRVVALDAERAIVVRGTDIEAAAAGQVITAARH